LELRDAAFRRSLLLQLTLLLRYARAPAPSGAAGGAALKAGAAEEAAKLAARAAACLAAVPPAGKAFASAVEAAMERDRNWVLWKAAGCKARARAKRDACSRIRILTHSLTPRFFSLPLSLLRSRSSGRLCLGSFRRRPRPLLRRPRACVAAVRRLPRSTPSSLATLN
jgi:hypothetical protein